MSHISIYIAILYYPNSSSNLGRCWCWCYARYLTWTNNFLSKPFLISIFFANCTSLPININIHMYVPRYHPFPLYIYLSIYLSVHLFIYIICWCAAQKGWDLSKTKRPARTWPFTTNTIWYNRILQCPRSFLAGRYPCSVLCLSVRPFADYYSKHL